MYLLAAIANPQDFFTLGSFTTLLGATGIVYIICGVVQSVFNFGPKWFALFISIVVSFIGLGVAKASASPEQAYSAPSWISYLVTFLNGFLIFSSATGVNQVASKNPPPPSPPTGAAPTGKKYINEVVRERRPRRFSDNWWK